MRRIEKLVAIVLMAIIFSGCPMPETVDKLDVRISAYAFFDPLRDVRVYLWRVLDVEDTMSYDPDDIFIRDALVKLIWDGGEMQLALDSSYTEPYHWHYEYANVFFSPGRDFRLTIGRRYTLSVESSYGRFEKSFVVPHPPVLTRDTLKYCDTCSAPFVVISTSDGAYGALWETYYIQLFGNCLPDTVRNSCDNYDNFRLNSAYGPHYYQVPWCMFDCGGLYQFSITIMDSAMYDYYVDVVIHGESPKKQDGYIGIIGSGCSICDTVYLIVE